MAAFTRQTREYALNVSLLSHPSFSKPSKKILELYDIKVTNSTIITLRNLLTKTKTTPPYLNRNTIYFLYTYNGQMYTDPILI